ncbi:TLP18.3/Psb32/MOLO-1 phosphatase superfamily protein [Stenotrophomonas rhizophila]|uniref:TPM domain-containing protein n=1 Tax=Stenotrophomonas TaxID=40323 RepID=UPI000F4CC797|nr:MULTISPECIES: TPM domain-containing protein [Stenotrophomonas]MCW6029016.1 TPM domain-containing protein [Stenotrophomonas sp. SRS1]ROP79086.1 TLP18.3/Psb32/MOLO-1 phosphatase superfamily protein [Stenotrophomonas rhizophila]
MRWLRHVFSPSVRRAFPPAHLQAITDAITAGERRHGGQVMFAVEADLALAALWQGITAQQRAEQAFAQLRTWDTEHNNGVLIYLLLADHAIELVADRGLRGRIGEAQWHAICAHMQQRLREGALQEAVLLAIEEVSDLLAGHYPPVPGSHDDGLPDTPQMLG